MHLPQARSLLLLLLSGLLLAGCDSSGAGSSEERPRVMVRTTVVDGGNQVEPPLRFAGIVQARQRATLTFQVSGVLRERAVELGDQVEAGQLLARLYNPALAPARDSAQARLQELSTQLEQSERELRRSQQLFERNLVAEQTLEQVTAQRDSLRASTATAEAALAETSQMLAETELRAPFTGRIESLLLEKDEFVGAGQSVMRLSSPQGREVEVRLPAYLLLALNIGQELPVWSVQDRQQAPVTGRITEISQPGAGRGELHPVKVALPADTLEPGEPVEVGVALPAQDELRLPVLSVMRSSTGASVFRVTDGHAHRVPVTLLRLVGEQVVVSAAGDNGLEAGDQVVYAGMTRLADGDAVEVQP
ncbi:MAG: efflux RND transporter periplasmic adaptor subunit [Halomonadaceae bacterium]|nr:MAG: efflux RND transporter periplasmic adaptor subunit [Halomonadaceae bacterium]